MPSPLSWLLSDRDPLPRPVRSAELFPFTMAFQPIVSAAGVFAQEALVRGPAGESAESILSQVHRGNLFAFDQAARVKAISLAAELALGTQLRVAINFIPGAVGHSQFSVQQSIETAERVGMDPSRIIFEIAEGEKVSDRQRLVDIFREYRRCGLQTAIDDFGAGYAGLELLAEFQPDMVKLDMMLIRSIESRSACRTIVRSVVALCGDLGILTIAEGVETRAEFQVLQELGVELFQGHLFARPLLEGFATHTWPESTMETTQPVPEKHLASLPRMPGAL